MAYNKRSTCLLAIALFIASFANNTYARLQVFACENEWAELAKLIGGDRVTAHSATSYLQDPHHIQARPSLIAKARQADLLFCTGAQLEVGWLPVLLKKSGNPAIQQGQTGHLLASNHVRLLEKLAHVDRSMGDVHKAGNPHIQLDPNNMLLIAKVLQQRLEQIDPKHAAHYQKNLEAFSTRWSQAITGWTRASKSLHNKKIIVHHNSYVYLNHWLGLQQIATLEPKPGIPPSSRHLNKLLKLTNSVNADFILLSSYQNNRGAKWLSQRTNLPYLTINLSPKNEQDLFTWFNKIIDSLMTSQTAQTNTPS